MAFLEDEISFKSGDSSSSGKIKFLCSFGGKIMARPTDNQLRYMGGETRILAVGRNISYLELMEKLVNLCGSDHISVKYQLPGEDLDALVSLICDDDIEIMMEEYERLEAIDVSVRLRLFMFPSDKKVLSNDAMEKERALNAKEQAKDVETVSLGGSSLRKVQNYQATRVSEYLMGQQATIPAASLAPGMVVGRHQVCSSYVPVVAQVSPLIAGHSVPPGAVITQLSSMALASSVAVGNSAPIVSPIPSIVPSLANPAFMNQNPMVFPIPAVVPSLAPVVNPALLNPAVPLVGNTPVSGMANPVLPVNPLVTPVPAVVNTPVSGIVNHVLSVNPVSRIVNPVLPVVNNRVVNPAVSVSPLANPIPPVFAMVDPVASVNPLVNPVPPVSAMVNPVASVNPLVNPVASVTPGSIPPVNPVASVNPLVNPIASVTPGSIPPVINNPVSAMVNPAVSVSPLVNPVPPVSAIVNPVASISPLVNPVPPVSAVVNPVASANPLVNPVVASVNPGSPPVINNPVSAMVNPVASVNPLVNPVPPVSALVNPAASVAPVSPVVPVVNPVLSVNPVSGIVNPISPVVNNPVSAMVNPVTSVNPMANPVPVSAMVNPVAPVIPLVPPVSALVNPVTSVPLVNPLLNYVSRAEERVPVAVIAPAGSITPAGASVFPVAPYVTVPPVQDRASTSYVPTTYVPVAEDTQVHLKGAALRKSREEVVVVSYQDVQASRASTTLLSGASQAMNMSQQGLMRSGSGPHHLQGCSGSGPQYLQGCSGSGPQYLQGFPRFASGSSHAGFPRSGSGSAHSSFSRTEAEDIAREALACNEERVIHSAAPAAQVLNSMEDLSLVFF